MDQDGGSCTPPSPSAPRGIARARCGSTGTGRAPGSRPGPCARSGVVPASVPKHRSSGASVELRVWESLEPIETRPPLDRSSSRPPTPPPSPAGRNHVASPTDEAPGSRRLVHTRLSGCDPHPRSTSPRTVRKISGVLPAIAGNRRVGARSRDLESNRVRESRGGADRLPDPGCVDTPLVSPARRVCSSAPPWSDSLDPDGKRLTGSRQTGSSRLTPAAWRRTVERSDEARKPCQSRIPPGRDDLSGGMRLASPRTDGYLRPRPGSSAQPKPPRFPKHR